MSLSGISNHSRSINLSSSPFVFHVFMYFFCRLTENLTEVSTISRKGDCIDCLLLEISFQEWENLDPGYHSMIYNRKHPAAIRFSLQPIVVPQNMINVPHIFREQN